MKRFLDRASLAILPLGLALATCTLVGCAAPNGEEPEADSSMTPEGAKASDSAALVTPPAGSGGFVYIGDYTFENGGKCIQPVVVKPYGTLPRMESCANAAARLSVYQQPDGNYEICVRNSLRLGTYEDPYENDYYAYVGNCLSRTDKNSLQFWDGATLSIKWDSRGFAANPGRFIDKGAGKIGYDQSTRLVTHLPPNAILDKAVAGSAAQVWKITKL